MVRSLFVFGLVLACGGRSEADCAGLGTPEERDWCRYELVGPALDGRSVEEVVQQLNTLETQLVRAAAVDRILMERSEGLQAEDAALLCGVLEGPANVTCQGRWKRPHLWVQ